MTDYKPMLVHNFTTLWKIHKENGEVWKERSYAKVVKQLKASTTTITSIDDLTPFAFGKSTYAKAVSIITQQDDLEQVKNNTMSDMNTMNTMNALEELSKVYAIGTVKAKQLVTDHQIETIDQLRSNLHLLNEPQQKGLKYHDNIMQRIPRNEMKAHEKLVSTLIDKHIRSSIDTHSIVGSYRREKEHSGDIDLILCVSKNAAKTIDTLVEVFLKERYVPTDGVFAKGKKKFMGVCKLDGTQTFRRLDIIVCTPFEYPFAILYFTGSGEFNVKMRDHAKKKGYRLNEKGITLIETKENVEGCFDSEHAIFTFLNVEYLDPPLREVENFKLLNNSSNTEM